MLKKLMTIILVVELGLLYLPEKYIFASEDDPQTETETETANSETDETISEEPTIPTIPEMSGIEDNTTATETEPVTDVILEEAPVEDETTPEETPLEEASSIEEAAPIETISQPVEPMNNSTQNDLQTEDKWFIFNSDTNTITGYSSSTSAPKNIIIPSTIGGIPVYNIGDNAFAGQQLTGLTLPNGLKSIGVRAFQNNSNMTGNLVIPDSVTSMGEGAFHTCSGLTGVTIGNHVTIIENETFYGCQSLNSVMISNSVTRIENKVFFDCSSLTIVTIPNSVTRIGEYAFYSCGLTSVTIPNSVTYIGSSAFSCRSLISITIPDKNEGEISGAPWGSRWSSVVVYWKDVKQAGDYLFNTSTNSIKKYTGVATVLTIPSTLIVDGISYQVKKIREYTFYENKILTNVTIPNSVTYIENYAFELCSSLTSVTIGSGVNIIEMFAFMNCNALTSISILSKNEGEISKAPWGGKNAIVYWKDVSQTGDYLFNTTSGTIIQYSGSATTLIIPSSLMVNGALFPVKKIGNNAFLNKTLISVTIPNSVTNLGESAFRSCSSLTSIIIPDSVTSIENSVFENCSGLTNVTIGNGVLKIGHFAFRACSSLTSIVIPNNVVDIHGYAFSDCDAIIRIDIPGINEGDIKDAPWGARNAIVYWKDTKQVGDYLFNPISGTILKYSGIATTLNIPTTLSVDGTSYPVKMISSNSFYNNKTITNITIPDSVTTIYSSAFSGCDVLTSIHIPSKNEGEIKGASWGAYYAMVYWKDLKKIGDYLFNTTKGEIRQYLGTDPVVTIPSYFTVDDTDYPVKVIGKMAFSDNITIIDITIPNSVINIEESAFTSCVELKNVTMGNNVSNIGNNAFFRCFNLISISIPDSVTSIGDRAFSRCKLQQIVVSKNLTSMAEDVFSGMSSLQIIYMRGSRTGLPSSITSAQPWGAPASPTVWYGGDIVTFDHVVKKIPGQYNRILDIHAFLNKPALINRITLPNGTIKYIAKSNWPDEINYYPYGSIPEEAITANGTYVFKGYGDDNVERTYAVEINDIGIITLRANETSITEQTAPTTSEQDILELLNVSAEDEAGVLTSGTDCTFWISPEDMNKIHSLHVGDVTTIRVNVKSSRSGQEMTSYRDVTLNTTSCVIRADNVDLWPPQSKAITKQQLLDLMNVSVIDSEGATDMTKLVMSDEDFNKIKTGIIGTYNVLLTYDTNKSKKRVRVSIIDDSPAALIKIPSEIKMNNIDHDPVYGVGAEEVVSIHPTAVSYYPQPFKIETDPSFWLESTAAGAAWINRMKVVVLDTNNQPLPDNRLLATLSSSTIQSVPFKLRGYHNEWNSKGAYSGIMTFTITCEDQAP